MGWPCHGTQSWEIPVTLCHVGTREEGERDTDPVEKGSSGEVQSDLQGSWQLGWAEPT